MAETDPSRKVGKHKAECECGYCKNARQMRSTRTQAPPAPAPAGGDPPAPPTYRARRPAAKAKKPAKPSAEPPAAPAPERSSGGGFLGGLIDAFRG